MPTKKELELDQAKLVRDINQKMDLMLEKLDNLLKEKEKVSARKNSKRD